MIVHVTGAGRDRLSPIDGHLVRNLDWDRFTPDALDGSVDALVASASTPADAVDLVGRVRDAGSPLPLLLLGDGTPGWDSVASAFTDVMVVPDLATLSAHLGAAHPSPHEPHQDEASRVIDLRRQVPRGGGRGLLRARLGDGSEQIGRSMRDFDRGLVREHDRPSDTPTPAADPPPRTLSAAPEAAWPSGPVRAPEEKSKRRSRRETASPEALVGGLLEVTDRLYGVRETGTAIAGHVKESVGCDAVAVLLPDGPLWTVVGAIGHRPLEQRLSIGADHWLVQEVSEAHHGVVVEDTDIARSRLAGAPLAAWPHLMACPLPDVRGIVVLGRSETGPAFSSRDLGRASGALADADPLFRSALQLRELARRLITFSELEES